jgi:hypothetical protein
MRIQEEGRQSTRLQLVELPMADGRVRRVSNIRQKGQQCDCGLTRRMSLTPLIAITGYSFSCCGPKTLVRARSRPTHSCVLGQSK